MMVPPFLSVFQDPGVNVCGSLAVAGHHRFEGSIAMLAAVGCSRVRLMLRLAAK